MKKKTRVFSFMLFLILALAFTMNVNAASKKKPSISAKNMTVDAGSKNLSLGVRVTKGLKVTYKSSNTAVLTVNSKGQITTKRAGSAYVTISTRATSAYAAGSRKIKITVVKASNITYYNEISALYVGETASLDVHTSGGSLTYKSSNPKVVTVNSKGNVRAIAQGKAKISFSSKGNSAYLPFSSSVTITVKKKPAAPKLKYNYEVKCFNQPYVGFTVAYFVKTNNPNPRSFNVTFYDPSGKPIPDGVYVNLGTLFDIYNADFLQISYCYKVPGGFVWVKSLEGDNISGVGSIKVREDIKDYPKGEWYRPGFEYAEKTVAKVRLLSYEQEYVKWMKEIINKTTTSSMTKPEKMTAISKYLNERATYPEVYTTKDGATRYTSVLQTKGIPHFVDYTWDSCTSPYMLERFGELIGYPLDSLYDNPPGGDWVNYHFYAQSLEDGSLYECCPPTETGRINISSPKEYPQIDCLTYTGYYKY